MGKRAAIYLRVSTARQAEKDLSIPDQRRQLEDYSQRKGWKIVGEYVEPGASATDDKRPAFQRMMDDAQSDDRHFDVVIVHSFSRFFRDAYQFEFYRRKLDRSGIDIVSITQELGNDPMGEMVRQILNLFDEYQSKENSKHVLRAMKENARQGFWNGSHPPYGYKTVAVEVRTDVIKKKLDIEPSEADVVRQAFNLYRQGNGIRAIANILNSKGMRYRKERPFNVSLLHTVLTRTAYKGTHYFNKTNYKNRAPKDPSEWVAFETPVIIETEVFDSVQDLLTQRRPSNTPPRVVNGPTLLTGIAKCGTCGGGMTLRTGKGGRYRYYTCNKRATEGKSSCEGRNFPMEILDEIVLGHLEEKLFQVDRLEVVLNELIRRNAENSDQSLEEEKLLRKELRATEEKIDRLYDALAEGTIEDKDGFRRSVSKFEQRRDELLRQTSGRRRRRAIPSKALSPQNISAFAEIARKRLRGKDKSFSKSYLRLFVERIEVRDEEIQISGPKLALANAISESTKPNTNAVPSFVSDWWAHKDSNLGPAD